MSNSISFFHACRSIIAHCVFCVLSMFILHSRESELYRHVFGRYVRTRLGVAISEVSRATCLPKDGSVHLSALP